jgi:hypothetical protein
MFLMFPVVSISLPTDWRALAQPTAPKSKTDIIVLTKLFFLEKKRYYPYFSRFEGTLSLPSCISETYCHPARLFDIESDY